jgi:hypothetical protein
MPAILPFDHEKNWLPPHPSGLVFPDFSVKNPRLCEIGSFRTFATDIAYALMILGSMRYV